MIRGISRSLAGLLFWAVLAPAAPAQLLVTDLGTGAGPVFNPSTGAYQTNLIGPSGNGPAAATIGPDGNLYVSNQFANTIDKYTAGGTPLGTVVNLGAG